MATLREARNFVVRQSVGTEAERANERSMDDEIGVTADRRREVRVADKVQTEVTDVLRRVFGLRLRAQDDLIDEIGNGQVFGLLQELC